MWTFIVFLSIFLGLAFTFNGFRLNHHYFWLGGLCFYITSFLGSMSIGLYLFVLPILLWVFALTGTFGLLKKPRHYLYFSLLSLVIWYFAVTRIDDFNLFYPFKWI